MAEQFSNDAVTTLSAGITSGTTSISVVDGSKFPTTGNFRIKIDSEYIICTGRSGNSLTTVAAPSGRGAESSSAASHNSGATVRHVITAGGLLQALTEGGHTQAHAISSTSDHSASGLTAGWVLGADSSTTFSWQQLLHEELGTIGSDDHHTAGHTITSGAHTGSLEPTSTLYTGVTQVSRTTAALALTASMQTVGSFAIAAAEVWRVDYIAHVTTSANTSDIQVQWSVPANVTYWAFQVGGLEAGQTATTGVPDSAVWTSSTKTFGALSASAVGLHVTGMVISSTGAGTCNFQAQETATDAVIQNGCLTAWRVA